MTGTLALPVIGSARAVEDEGLPILVLNVEQDKEHPDGYLKMQGTAKFDIPGVIGQEAMVQRMSLGWTQPEVDEEPEELPTTIVLRSDQSTQFKVVNYVITCCQAKGYRKFALRTRMQEGKP